ncbi:transcriptional regulator [Zhouia amylolytica]|uniref:transcriptional regulator n=1 Tax=Zhouia amylolytica TaxID=376730 RepID=UPI0020CC9452|nr:tetratricopeptide repeat protein [Zhouia amylolytica]MCQ0113021.1 tetratricopeptide repeat protein [Zhouia amylolytica]
MYQAFAVRISKVVLLLLFSIGYSQEAIDSEEALLRHQELTATMNAQFPVDDIKTFRRESFTEDELQEYLMKHFERMELLPFITDHITYKLDSYFHSGNWFYQIGLPEESIISNKEALKYYHQVSDELTKGTKEEFYVKVCFAYSALAENYARLSLNDSAAVYHLKNIDFAQSRNTPYYPSALNNLGLFHYWSKNETDTALVYFKKAFDITKAEFPNHYLIGSIRDNIADIYMDQGKTEEAGHLYGLNFDFYQHIINKDLKSLDMPRIISAGAQHMNATLKQDKLEDAQQTYFRLNSLINDPENKAWDYQKSMPEFLEAKSILLYKKGAFKEAYENEQYLNQLSDSLYQVSKDVDKRWLTATNDIVLDKIRLNYKMEQSIKENKIKNQRLKLYISASLSLLVITLLTSLFFSRRQHLINARNKRLLAEERLKYAAVQNEHLENEVAAKKRDLSDFAINLSQNQKWAELLANKIETLKATKGRQRKSLMDELEQEIKNKVNFDSENKEFYERLDKLSDAFYRKLKSKFPELSKTDKRLCSLIRLKINSNEIARLQNITIASLNTSRYRLRKKLNLAKEVDLDDFIQSL